MASLIIGIVIIILSTFLGVALVIGCIISFIKKDTDTLELNLRKFISDDTNKVFEGINELRNRPILPPTFPTTDLLKDTVKVYAVYLYNSMTKQQQLVISVADTYDVALINSMDLLIRNGQKTDNWIVTLYNSIDVPVAKEKSSKIKKNSLEEFVNSLIYCKENFAQSSYEKGALTRVINNIKVKYAK